MEQLHQIIGEDLDSGRASRREISGRDLRIKVAGKGFMESPGDPVRQFHVTFEDDLTISIFNGDLDQQQHETSFLSLVMLLHMRFWKSKSGVPNVENFNCQIRLT
ncbi:uncharacterized protein LOC121993844 [Zingiber officinale]|uniref:uncharacterized protein LOC121993844 n=1 Tax=Zingiber officinale TaxID=94328 RepID=UPI001C4B5B50|nr:uncharacterized protein LOC121993844 [Zingiber officinale]